jgi:enoyl-CoA hydratase/carnithine racemase
VTGTPTTRFHLNPVETRIGRIALVTMDNGEDWQKPNVFGREALESLEALTSGLREGGWRGIVLTGKPFVFAAGADLDEFPRMTKPEHARQAAVAGHRAFASLRALAIPSLAAINGACVGGGLEIALHCDYRTVSLAVRHIGFPEVFLGIVPGWGGTQLAPRLLGAARAVELVVSNPLEQNRLIDGARAVEKLGRVE